MGSIEYAAVADIDAFLADVRAEFLRARNLFPPKPEGQPTLAAFFEEAGEVSKSLLDHSYGKETVNGVYTECVQAAAAMAARLAMEGSIEFPSYIRHLQSEIKTP